MKAGSLSDNDKHRLVLSLLKRLRCVECKEPYDLHDFVLVGRHKDVWMLGIHCRKCGASGHVIVVIHLADEAHAVTDLTPEEEKRLELWPPITADDVLDVHEFVKGFDGDFEALFAR